MNRRLSSPRPSHLSNLHVVRAAASQALIAACALVLCAGSVSARACPVEGWTPGEPIPGVDGEVQAMTVWDPDGNGPLAPKIVIGGTFTTAGNVAANNIAALDTATNQWSALSTGMTNTGAVAVYALAVLNTGELVAGGEFNTAGGVACRRLAKWNGTAWSTLPSGVSNGVNGTVRSLLMHPDGNLIAGGDMTSGNPDFSAGPLRWNPVQGWRAMGTGLAPVRSMAMLPSGDVVVGGNFLFDGPNPYNSIARWDGTQWQHMGSGIAGGGPAGTVYSVTATPAGEVVAVGQFSSAGGVPVQNVAKWDGSAWSAMGTGLPYFGSSVLASADGRITAAVFPFNSGSGQTGRLFEWNGTAWQQTNELWGTINTLTSLPSGEVALGGSFEQNKAATRMLRVARRGPDGYTYNLGRNADNAAEQLAVLPNGQVAAFGYFTSLGGSFGAGIGLWNGSAWTNLSSDLSNVSAVAVLSNGDLVAKGVINSQAFHGFIRWNGTQWLPITPFTARIDKIVPTPDGGFYALGVFTNWGTVTCKNIMRWSPISGPSALGTGFTGVSTDLKDAIVTANGDLIVSGRFTVVDSVPVTNIARWNGSSWSSIGTGLSSYVETIIELPNGNLIAGGAFSAGGIVRLARWDGVAWTQFAGGANNTVESLVRLPNGHIFATGYFTQIGGTTVSRFARWDGTSWSSLGAGLADTITNFPYGAALAYVPQTNEVFVAGQFSKVNTQVSAYLGRYALGGIAAAVAQPPASGGKCLGSPASLSVVPAGTFPMTFQWRKGGTPIDANINPSAATANLILSTVGFADGASYDCIITNDCGNATSPSASLSVLPDFNADTAVNTPDLVFMLGAFGTTVPAFTSADINGDGAVNTADLVSFLAAFGQACP